MPLRRVTPPLTTSLLFSGSFVAARVVTLEFDPLTATLLRYLVALAFLGTLAWAGSQSLRISRRDALRFLGLGLFGIAGYHYFFFLSLRYTDVVNTAILNGLSPVITAVLAALFIRERLAPKHHLGIACSVAGVLVLLTGGRVTALVELSFNRGDLLMLVAVVSWAAYALLIRTMVARYSVFCLTFYATVFGVVLLAVLAAREGPLGQLAAASTGSLWSLAYMGVAASGVGYLLYNSSVRLLGPTTTAAIVYSLVPVWTAALGALFFGEALSTSTVLSVVLIIAGLQLALAPRQDSEVSPRTPPRPE